MLSAVEIWTPWFTLLRLANAILRPCHPHERLLRVKGRRAYGDRVPVVAARVVPPAISTLVLVEAACPHNHFSSVSRRPPVVCSLV